MNKKLILHGPKIYTADELISVLQKQYSTRGNLIRKWKEYIFTIGDECLAWKKGEIYLEFRTSGGADVIGRPILPPQIEAAIAKAGWNHCVVVYGKVSNHECVDVFAHDGELTMMAVGIHADELPIQGWKTTSQLHIAFDRIGAESLVYVTVGDEIIIEENLSQFASMIGFDEQHFQLRMLPPSAEKVARAIYARAEPQLSFDLTAGA